MTGEAHSEERKVTIRADTREELFVEAARMVSRQCGQVGGDPGPWHTIRLSEPNDALLLVDWLNELISRSASERRAFDDVLALRLHDGRLTAEVRGRRVIQWTSLDVGIDLYAAETQLGDSTLELTEGAGDIVHRQACGRAHEPVWMSRDELRHLVVRDP